MTDQPTPISASKISIRPTVEPSAQCIDLSSGTFSSSTTPTGLIIRQFLLAREANINQHARQTEGFLRIVDEVAEKIKQTPTEKLNIHSLGLDYAAPLTAVSATYFELLHALKLGQPDKRQLITKYLLTHDPRMALGVYSLFHYDSVDWDANERERVHVLGLLGKRDLDRFLHNLFSSSNAFWFNSSPQTLDHFCSAVTIDRLVASLKTQIKRYPVKSPHLEGLEYLLIHACLNQNAGDRHLENINQLYATHEKDEIRERIAKTAASSGYRLGEFYLEVAAGTSTARRGVMAIRHFMAENPHAPTRALAPLLNHSTAPISFETLQTLLSNEMSRASGGQAAISRIETDLRHGFHSPALLSLVRLCDATSPVSTDALALLRELCLRGDFVSDTFSAIMPADGVALGVSGIGEKFPLIHYQSFHQVVHQHLAVESALLLLNEPEPIASNFEIFLRTAYDGKLDLLLVSLKNALERGAADLYQLAYRAAGFVPNGELGPRE